MTFTDYMAILGYVVFAVLCWAFLKVLVEEIVKARAEQRRSKYTPFDQERD